MVRGIGTDIVEISRIEQVLKRHGDRFANRILTPSEFKKFNASPNQARYLAKRFAIKEAVVKSLGTGIAKGVSWQHITTSNNEAGQPHALLSGAAQSIMDELGASVLHVSVSDESAYVVAFAVLS